MGLLKPIDGTDQEMRQWDAQTAAILAGFEIAGYAEDLRNAVRCSDPKLALRAHAELTRLVANAGTFLNIAFPVPEHRR